MILVVKQPLGPPAYIYLSVQNLDLLRRTAGNIKDPLFRFFEREVRLTLDACYMHDQFLCLIIF